MVKYTQKNGLVTILAKNSAALVMYEAKDFKKLDEHLKECDRKRKELEK